MASEKIVIAVASGFTSGQLMSCCLDLLLILLIVVLLSTDSLLFALFICLSCDVMLWLWVCIDR